MADPLRRRIALSILLAVVACVAGCATEIFGRGSMVTPMAPPPGFFYTNYKAPLMVDTKATSLGTKTGRSDTSYFMVPFLWWDFAWGDAALQRAAQNGSLSRVSHADYEEFSILGLYKRVHVIAYGE